MQQLCIITMVFLIKLSFFKYYIIFLRFTILGLACHKDGRSYWLLLSAASKSIYLSKLVYGANQYEGGSKDWLNKMWLSKCSFETLITNSKFFKKKKMLNLLKSLNIFFPNSFRKCVLKNTKLFIGKWTWECFWEDIFSCYWFFIRILYSQFSWWMLCMSFSWNENGSYLVIIRS